MCGRYYIDDSMIGRIEKSLSGIDNRLSGKTYSGDIYPTNNAPVISAASDHLQLEENRSGYNQDFFEAHRELLTLRRAARKAFDEYEAVYGKGCRPKVKELNAEYTEILRRRKQNYAEYCRLREVAKKWQTACGIVQKILEAEPERDRAEERQTQNQQNKTNR